MKALVYLGPRRMEVQEVPQPVPGAGEVLVRVRASAICGSDLHGFRHESSRRVPPLVMGHEVVGAIHEVGVGVDDARVGERTVLKPILACGECAACRMGRLNHCRDGRLVGRDLDGGFAEYLAIPSGAAVNLPDGVPDDIGTLTEPLSNAVHVASRSVSPGDEVFVIGAGPIGVLMARASLLFGAARVFITDPVTERLDLARAQGAEPLIADDPLTALLETTKGEGAGLVIDAAGFESTWSLALRAVAIGGRIREVGLGSASGTLDYVTVLEKEATITGSYAWTDEDFGRALELLTEGRLDPRDWITHLPLAQGQRAFEELEHATGPFKVVLDPWAGV